jgi:hypothetical protein
MDPLFIAIYRHFVQAQTASNKTSLTAVMSAIEQQFNIKFSRMLYEPAINRKR